jgi:hypothetical protein
MALEDLTGELEVLPKTTHLALDIPGRELYRAVQSPGLSFDARLRNKPPVDANVLVSKDQGLADANAGRDCNSLLGFHRKV